jgi:hypothetical protein
MRPLIALLLLSILLSAVGCGGSPTQPVSTATFSGAGSARQHGGVTPPPPPPPQ